MVETKVKFDLDQFQKDAIEALNQDKSVIVCAPTGSGKTLIAQQAIELAIKESKKVFYTAPLKALINQKYEEFTEAYGSDNVGILTGDTAKNRDAKIIVMTAEIYRNMLYGTSFGSVDPYLDDLKYVIFDEFHYIGDENRGTVWEESVVYSPKSIRIVALSATINNAESLKDWIAEIHSDCQLVESSNRPVPIHHLYFKESQLFPLLTNNKLNPKLKERIDNKFGKRNKFSYKNNKKSGAIRDLLIELKKRQMLPAIYFLFSRKGCDSTARECLELELLTQKEKEALNTKIDAVAKDNSYIKNYNQIDVLRSGVASHHSGLLPAVKKFIEELFSEGLIKVVFSTETLAAGINMPARTTVISSITKAGDNGFRNLKPSEFLQMSGRAGRRGLDDIGYTVTLKHNNETASEAAHIASSDVEDIESNLKPSYEMVLNLLSNKSIKEVKELIKNSFGQSLIKQTIKPLKAEHKDYENRLWDLQAPLCPGELGDLKQYKEIQEKLDKARKKKKKLEKAMSGESDISMLEDEIEIVTIEAQNSPCNGCPKQKPCSKQMDNIKRFRKKTRDLDTTIKNKENIYWENFERVISLLKSVNYVTEGEKLTDKGINCSKLRANNSYFLTELIHSEFINNLSEKELAIAISSISVDTRLGRDYDSLKARATYYNTFESLNQLSRNVIRTQRQNKIEIPADVNEQVTEVISAWFEAESWEDLMNSINAEDGDVLRILRRALDVSKQLLHIDSIDKAIKDKLKNIVMVLDREPIREAV